MKSKASRLLVATLTLSIAITSSIEVAQASTTEILRNEFTFKLHPSAIQCDNRQPGIYGHPTNLTLFVGGGSSAVKAPNKLLFINSMDVETSLRSVDCSDISELKHETSFSMPAKGLQVVTESTVKRPDGTCQKEFFETVTIEAGSLKLTGYNGFTVYPVATKECIK